MELRSFDIRPFTAPDYQLCAQIYAQGIATGYATFETEVPTWPAWDQKYSRSCRLVCTLAGQVVGWAALTPFSNREVYKGVAEISIYMSTQASGKGYATALLNALVRCSENQGFWSLLAKIFPENKASLHIHLKNGFKVVGTLDRIGMLNGKWHDNLLLQRRSTIAT